VSFAFTRVAAAQSESPSQGHGQGQDADPALTLAWTAPAECPDRSAIERAVNNVVGHSEQGAAPLAARAVVSHPTPETYSVALAIETEPGHWDERSLSGPTCASVSDATALLIALAMRAEHEKPSSAVADHPPREPTRPSPTLGVGFAIDAGSTPKLTYGPLLLITVPVGPVRVEATAAGFISQRAQVSGTDIGADLSLFAFGARACFPLWDGALWVAPCAGVGVDWTRAAGFGARQPKNAASIDGVARAGASAQWDLRAGQNTQQGVSLRVDLEAALPFERPQFDVDGAGAVYRRNSAAFRSSLDLLWRF